MKQMATKTKFMVVMGSALVAVLALSGAAWAATALTLTKTVPNGGATGVSRTVNIKAYFNHDMKRSTLTSSTFKIRKKGTTTWLGAARSVNNTISPTSSNARSQSLATLNPNANLASNTTYQVLVVGGSSGVKDLNGKTLGSTKSFTFTTARRTSPPPSGEPPPSGDTTPPNTNINTKPANPSNDASPTFTFSGTDDVTPSANLIFQCKLDGGDFAGCTSPKSYSNLSDGSHTFSVRAKDAAGNVDGSPDSYTWRVDTTQSPPQSPIQATPSTVDFGGFAYCPTDPPPVENVTLKNITTQPITVVPSVSGTDASSFSVPTDQITLAPGDTSVVPVTFTPSGAWGPRTASLELKGAGGNTVLTVPLKAAVKCPVEG
jgi:Bacterial Ig-like domain